LLKCCIGLVFFVAGLWAQSADGGCALARAIQLHQSGDLDGAIREYRACLASDPNRIETRSNLGAVLAKAGRYQEAIEQYQQALKSAPLEYAVRLRFNLALAYYKSFQIPMATAELEGLHASQPLDSNITLLLADCHLRTGAFQKAIELLSPIEASQPDNDGLAYALGMALIRSGRIDDGQKRVERIMSKGESAEGHFLMGSAMFMARNYPAAIGEFARAAALNPNVPSLESYYGQALLATGDADAAAEAFRKELASNPNDYDANFQLASIFAHRGKVNEARPLLERAVQVRPGSIEARRALSEGFRFDAPAQPTGGIALGARAPAIGSFDPSTRQKPVVLVFGSYTCPKFRADSAALNRMYEQYRDQVDFRLIYIREAHADGSTEPQWQSTINQREGIDLRPARDMAEKQGHANLCIRKLGIRFPALVDTMDTAAEKAYDAWPSRVYLIGRDGRVAVNSRLGELDFDAGRFAAAIRETLAAGIAHGGSR
jgi:tetratricopeptide (TPR) repeat protein